jgi:hypothetical protein
MSKVNFKGGNIAKTIQKRKGFEILIISKDNFQGKGRTNNQNNTETKQNEKKGKGFEKKLLVAIPKDQGPFSKQRKESENAKGRNNRNEKTMKKINGDKKGMIIFNSKNDDQNGKMKK